MLDLNRISKKLADCSVELMEHAGYKARIMCAERLKGDKTFGLPPGVPFHVIPTSYLPSCPDSWVRGSGSYVVPIDGEDAFWFDWTMNNPYSTAVIPSVKRMNPITGRPIDELRMEQYSDKCPVHDVSFSHGLFCEKCGYQWAPQNFVSYPNTAWQDGFRHADGKVRQFFFTEDEMRDVASAVIGKENTVPAFGFAFFKTKVEPIVQKQSQSRFLKYIAEPHFLQAVPAIYLVDKSTSNLHWKGGGQSAGVTYTSSHSDDGGKGLCSIQSASITSSISGASAGFEMDSCDVVREGFTSLGSCDTSGVMLHDGGPDVDSLSETPKIISKSFSAPRSVMRSVSVGAGAEINQGLKRDMRALDEWISEPQSIIRLYFVGVEQLVSIVERGGIVEPVIKSEGYISKVVVG